MTTTAQIIAGFYNVPGITTESTVTTLSVGAGASQVALNNPNRVAGLFINISSDIIYLGYDAGVNSNEGILLVPNGGSYNVELTSDFGLTGYATYGISTGTASNLIFVETQLNN